MADALGDLAQLRGIVHGQQGDELLATQTYQQVIRAQCRTHAPGALPEDLVAATMAKLVVDLLEVVEVDVDGAQAQAGILRAGHLALEELVEGGAVPQLGQRVDQRLALLAIHRLAQRVGLLAHAAHVQIAFHQDAKVVQARVFARAEGAGFGVDQAQRADWLVVAAVDRLAGVEAHIGWPGDHRVVGKARIAQGVFHHQRLAGRHGVAAERGIAGRRIAVQADAGLEPLTITVDQADQYAFHFEQLAGQVHQGIQVQLGRRVEQFHVVQGALAQGFICGNGGRLHIRLHSVARREPGILALQAPAEDGQAEAAHQHKA